jgi:cytochrome c553
MRCISLIVALTLTASMTSTGAFADGAKLMKDKGCVACHGNDGNGAVLADGKIDPQYPILAGQYASYLEYALQSYQNGTRNNAVMLGYVEKLSAEDIKMLASYLSKQSSKIHDLKGLD